MIPSKDIGRHPPARPSDKELWKKLEEAKMLIQQDRWAAADPRKLLADFNDLDDLGINAITCRRSQKTIIGSAG